MDNPETLATLDTQDTGQINVRENWRDNQECTIQRHWQEKTEGAVYNGQFKDTDNIWHTRHRTNKRKRNPIGQQSRMDNPGGGGADTIIISSRSEKRKLIWV